MNGMISKIRANGLRGSFEKAARRFSHGLKVTYYRARCVTKPVWRDPDARELALVERALAEKGVIVRDLFVDGRAFEAFKRDFVFGCDFYGGPGAPLYDEKALEHFIGYELGVRGLAPGKDVYVDVAAAESPWAKLLNEKGYRALAIDLKPSKRYGHLDCYRVMDATNTPFPDRSIGAVSLHCAYEMFTGPSDARLIDELARILVPGGRAVIVPLYMHTAHSGYSSAEYYFRKEFHDPGARLYKAQRNMTGVPFARFYDAGKLKERVLDKIGERGMSYKLHALRDGAALGAGIYCHFVLEITR